MNHTAETLHCSKRSFSSRRSESIHSKSLSVWKNSSATAPAVKSPQIRVSCSTRLRLSLKRVQHKRVLRLKPATTLLLQRANPCANHCLSSYRALVRCINFRSKRVIAPVVARLPRLAKSSVRSLHHEVLWAQLEVIPAQLRVIQHVRKRYACKGCEENIKTADKPPQSNSYMWVQCGAPLTNRSSCFITTAAAQARSSCA